LHAQDAQTPSFRAGVEALPVDVTVVDDKGQPIRDLLAADFTVRVDGRARRVVSAQWIAAGTGAPAAAAARVPEGFVSNESSAGALSGLREVLTSIKAVEGPKTVVFVSQGFFSDRERGDDMGRITEIGGLAAAARARIYSLRLEESNDITRQKATQPQLNME